jgi:hypothetical protein
MMLAKQNSIAAQRKKIFQTVDLVLLLMCFIFPRYYIWYRDWKEAVMKVGLKASAAKTLIDFSALALACRNGCKL